MQVVSAESKPPRRPKKRFAKALIMLGGSLSRIGGNVFLFDTPNVKKGQVGFLLCSHGAAVRPS